MTKIDLSKYDRKQVKPKKIDLSKYQRKDFAGEGNSVTGTQKPIINKEDDFSFTEDLVRPVGETGRLVLGTATQTVGTVMGALSDNLISLGGWVEGEVFGPVWAGISRAVGNERMAQHFENKGNEGRANAKVMARETSKLWNEGGRELREGILRGDQDYQDRKQVLHDRMVEQKRTGNNTAHLEDLTDSAFWKYDALQQVSDSLGILAVSLATTKGMGGVGAIATSTGTSLSMNASREADSKYSELMQKGYSQEEAILQADRVYERNFIANSVQETIQMAIINSLTRGKGSFLSGGFGTTAKIIGSGEIEMFQERGEDWIQGTSAKENLEVFGQDGVDFMKALGKLEFTDTDLMALATGTANPSVASASSYSYIKFKGLKEKLDGALGKEKASKFIAGLQETVKDRANKMSSTVLNIIPNKFKKEAKGKDETEKLNDIAIVNPEIVKKAVETIKEDVETAKGIVKAEEDVDNSIVKVEQLLNSGLSELEAKQQLGVEIGMDKAIDIVDSVIGRFDKLGKQVETIPLEKAPSRLESIVNDSIKDVSKKEEPAKVVKKIKKEEPTPEIEENRIEDVIKGGYTTEKELKFYLKNSKGNAGLSSVTRIQRKLMVGKTKATEIYNSLQKEGYILSDKEQSNINKNRHIENANQKKRLEAMIEAFEGNKEKSQEIIDSMEETQEFDRKNDRVIEKPEPKKQDSSKKEEPAKVIEEEFSISNEDKMKLDKAIEGSPEEDLSQEFGNSLQFNKKGERVRDV